MADTNLRALALDLGASGGKMFAGAFDGRRISMDEIHRFPNRPAERGEHLYWDFHGIYTHVLDGIRKAALGGFSSFAADAFCNDYGLLNHAGELIGPVYMYRDRRTEGIPEVVDKLVPPEELYRRTGCQRARFNTLVQLVAQTRGPDLGLLENASALLFVPDLLNYLLSGEKGAEHTIATVSQVFNRENASWDSLILNACGLPQSIFPPVIPSATVYASARPEIQETAGTGPFFICSAGHHDTASAVAAVPAREKNFAYISSGTWSLMGVETPAMITSRAAMDANFANEGGLGGRNRFLKNIMGLWLVQECLRDYRSAGMDLDFSSVDRMAELETPFRSLIDPDDPIFFEPRDMVGKIQTWCRRRSQPVPETPGQVNRCILESLALAYRRTLEQLEKLTGFSIPYVHIVGGGARNRQLNRFTACALGRPVYAGPVEAAALGNLCAQFIAGGLLTNLEQARAVIRESFVIEEYLPSHLTAWDDAHHRFVNLSEKCPPE